MRIASPLAEDARNEEKVGRTEDWPANITKVGYGYEVP
jgi:hypothetical protein